MRENFISCHILRGKEVDFIVFYFRVKLRKKNHILNEEFYKIRGEFYKILINSTKIRRNSTKDGKRFPIPP
jgi:hypothetical protein